jgi:hypothetical protein
MTDDDVINEAVEAIQRRMQDCKSDLKRFKDKDTQRDCMESMFRYEYSIARLRQFQYTLKLEELKKGP